MILEKSKASKGVAERRVSCMDQNTQTLRLSSVAPRLHTPRICQRAKCTSSCVQQRRLSCLPEQSRRAQALSG